MPNRRDCRWAWQHKHKGEITMEIPAAVVAKLSDKGGKELLRVLRTTPENERVPSMDENDRLVPDGDGIIIRFKMPQLPKLPLGQAPTKAQTDAANAYMQASKDANQELAKVPGLDVV